MKNLIHTILLVAALSACSESEPERLHPFKFEGTVVDESVIWAAPSFNFNYVLSRRADYQDDSVRYGLSLFTGNDRFFVQTKKITSQEFDTFFKAGTYPLNEGDFQFEFNIHNIPYRPDVSSGEFTITKTEYLSNSVRVWGTLNCKLDPVGNFPAAKSGLVKNGELVVEFVRATQQM